MSSEFSLRHRITFGEVDMGGMLHFSNYFKLMELCEHAFLKSLDIAYFDQRPDVIACWPRFHLEMQYLGAISYDTEVIITLLVTQKTSRSLTYQFFFHAPGVVRAKSRGKMTVVYVEMDRSSGEMKPLPIPKHLLDRIEVAGKDRQEALGG